MEPEMYSEYRKERQFMSGLEWDAHNNRWAPIDYTRLTESQLKQRREDAVARVDELNSQLKGLLPAAAAQHLINKGAVALEDLVIALAKRAPETLLGLI